VTDKVAALDAKSEQANTVLSSMCETLLKTSLAGSKLPPASQAAIEKLFKGRVFQPSELETAITGAMEIEGQTREQIVSILESGRSVKWCKSPNYYYDHSYGIIGRKRSAPPVVMVRCDCGHSVPQAQQMSSSLGTSCSDCYDRMSS